MSRKGRKLSEVEKLVPGVPLSGQVGVGAGSELKEMCQATVWTCATFPCRSRRLAGAMLGAGLAKVVLNLELKGQCITGAPPPRRPERRASARGRQFIQSGSA